MKMPLLTAIAIAAVTTFGIAAPASVQAQQAHIKLNSGNPASSHFALSIAFAESIKEGTNGDIEVDVLQSSGSGPSIRLLQRNEITFGICSGVAMQQAYEGAGPYEGNGYDGIRTFITYGLTPDILAVRADSGIKTVYDLEGKPFSAGIAGSSTALEVKSALDALGVTPDFYEASLDDAMEATKNNQIVGFTKSAGSLTNPDGSIMDVSALIEMRVLDMPEIDKIKAHDPSLMIAKIPAGVYAKQGHPGELNVIGHTSGFATNKDADPDVIYRSFKAIVEHQDKQAAVFPGVKNLDYVELMLEHATVPLHAGVVRYMKEKGIAVPDRLVPPEAK